MQMEKKINRISEIFHSIVEKYQRGLIYSDNTKKFLLIVRCSSTNAMQLAKVLERNERKARLKQLSKEVEFDLILEQNARG